jgi:hypothetical protein
MGIHTYQEAIQAPNKPIIIGVFNVTVVRDNEPDNEGESNSANKKQSFSEDQEANCPKEVYIKFNANAPTGNVPA